MPPSPMRRCTRYSPIRSIVSPFLPGREGPFAMPRPTSCPPSPNRWSTDENQRRSEPEPADELDRHSTADPRLLERLPQVGHTSSGDPPSHASFRAGGETAVVPE